MRLLPQGQRLGAYCRSLVACRRLTMGQRVEVARTVKTLHERQPRIPGGFGEIALRIGHEPGILVVTVGLFGNGLDLVLDLLQGPTDASDRFGPLLGRVVGQRVQTDQGVDILGICPQRRLECRATADGVAAEGGGTRLEVVHPRPDRTRVAADLLQDRIATTVSLALAAVQQPSQAGRGLVFPLLIVEKLREHDRGKCELRRRRPLIVDERTVFPGGPVGLAPLRQKDGRLQPVDELGIGASGLRKGGRGEFVGPGIAPA